MVLGLLIVVLVIMGCVLTRTCMIARRHGGYSNCRRQMHMQKFLRQHILSCPVAAQGAVVVDDIQVVATQKLPQVQWKVRTWQTYTLMAGLRYLNHWFKHQSL